MERRVNITTFRDLFTEFLNEKKSAGLTEPTLFNYEKSLCVLLSELGLDDLVEIKEFNKDLILKWIGVRQETGSKPSTINHYLRDIRVFMYWLMENEYIKSFRIKLLKESEPSIKRYSDEDLRKLVQTPSPDEPFWVWKSWLIAELGLGTGARLGSIMSISLNDIDFQNSRIHFPHSKTRDTLILPLAETLRASIKKYLSVWALLPDYRLICTETGDPYTCNRPVQKSFDQYCRLRGVEPRGIHALRHSFAYQLYKNGTDIVTIQYYLHHSDINMTRRYISKLSVEDVKIIESPLDLISCKKRIKRRELH